MAEQQFPDITSKLSAPSKKSLFERNRAEAEAKRIREEAQTAAVLKDFEKSFNDEEPDADNPPTKPKAFAGLEGFGAQSANGGASRRHFGGGSNRNSGTGSLGPTAPPSLTKKRTFDGNRVQESKGLFSHDDERERQAPMDPATAFRTSDDELETPINEDPMRRAVPKPTIQLSSLPPGSSPAVIKELLPASLRVSGVRIVTPQEPAGVQSSARRSMSAIVTLAQDTPGSDIDAAVNGLQNKYLGWGYYLSLSRHLSSATLSNIVSSNTSVNILPFGAKVPPKAAPNTMSRPTPSRAHRGFAPPQSYTIVDSDAARGVRRAHVPVQLPSDIKQIKLIHKTVENLVTHGPEFEALLMTRPEVQRDEKWAWIWDSRSVGGVWYRWRLWEILTGDGAKPKTSQTYAQNSESSKCNIFRGEPEWVIPETGLPFEFATELDEFVDDSGYDSSEEDESDDEDNPRKKRRQFDSGPRPESIGERMEKTFLNPLHRAKLTHLLSRLPITQAKLRRGDVARVTIFAIKHASEGADEVVDMLVGNVLRPLAMSTCGKHERELAKLVDEDRYSRSTSPELNGGDVDMSDAPPAVQTDSEAPTPTPATTTAAIPEPISAPTMTPIAKKEDTSPAQLLALHLISDILSASSTSGIRHAWRYRSLFESTLRRTHVFARLGRLDRDYGWGRLRADKWRRSVLQVLGLWESWSVFDASTVETLRKELEEPPLTEGEVEEVKLAKEKAEVGRKAKAAVGAGGGGKGRWKTVSHDAATAAWLEAQDQEKEKTSTVDNDGRDVDGGIPNLDGASETKSKPRLEATTAPDEMKAEDGTAKQDKDEAMLETTIEPTKPVPPTQPFQLPGETAAAAAKRRRPKAMDMFGE